MTGTIDAGGDRRQGVSALKIYGSDAIQVMTGISAVLGSRPQMPSP
jgi:hypothetical protein